MILIGIGVAVVAIAAVAMTQQDSNLPAQARPSGRMPVPASTPPARSSATPATQGAGSPQPGPAPPGKVWSVEHGHWHDEPAGGATAGTQGAPNQSQRIQMPAAQQANQPAGVNTPQPPGPAPEGKVWSPEHGHYHDAPKTTPATPAPGTGPN